MSKATPSTISSTFRIMASGKLNGLKAKKNGLKSELKTSKYSSSLIAVPAGSLILIRPEKINSTPTKIQQKRVIHFIIVCFTPPKSSPKSGEDFYGSSLKVSFFRCRLPHPSPPLIQGREL